MWSLFTRYRIVGTLGMSSASTRTCRDELFDQYLFAILDYVREATYWWMREYNEERPHDALDDQIPPRPVYKPPETLL